MSNKANSALPFFKWEEMYQEQIISSFLVRVIWNTDQGKENLAQFGNNAHSVYFHILVRISHLSNFFSPVGIDLRTSPYLFAVFFFLGQHTQFHVSCNVFEKHKAK